MSAKSDLLLGNEIYTWKSPPRTVYLHNYLNVSLSHSFRCKDNVNVVILNDFNWILILLFVRHYSHPNKNVTWCLYSRLPLFCPAIEELDTNDLSVCRITYFSCYVKCDKLCDYFSSVSSNVFLSDNSCNPSRCEIAGQMILK